MTITFRIELGLDEAIMSLLRKIIEEGIKVPESPEVTAFRESVSASLANISADIQRLLARNPGLSEEDKSALVQISTDLEAVAAVVPEDPPAEEGSERSRRRNN